MSSLPVDSSVKTPAHPATVLLDAQASTQRLPLVQKNGVWVFDLPADTHHVTAAQVKSLLDDTP